MDVARVAGVSRATVSYVINGLANGRVSISPETHQRVLDAVQQLGYQPDARAQSLRSGGRTNTLGLLVPDLHNPYYWKIAAGVEQEARKTGFDVVLFSTALDADREEHTLRALSRRQIDGLILNVTFPRRIQALVQTLARRHNAIVTLGGPFAEIDQVLIRPNYRQNAKELIGHLYTLGHRRIAFIYGLVNPEIDSGRLAAYTESLTGLGLPVEEQLIERCGATLAEGYAAAQRLIARRPHPTAIIALNDLLAIGVLRAVHEAGLSIPRDVSLAGFDDIDVAAFINPPLTTVHYDAHAAGREAVKMIVARLEEPERPVQVVYIPTRLILRDSTAAAPTS